MQRTQVLAHARREAILDILRQHPNGLTMSAIAALLGVPRRVANRDVRWLRRQAGVDNIPATPGEKNQPWVYTLTNEVEVNQRWAKNRMRDMESRFRTQIGQAATLVRVTDGRTVDGRKARKIERTLTYLMRELADIEGSVKFDGVLVTVANPNGEED